MDQVLQALGVLLAAVCTAVTPIIAGAVRAWAEAQHQAAMATLQARLGEGAARAAGEILATVRTDPSVQHATQAMVDLAAATLHARFAETIARYKIPADTLRGMIAGEVGKLGLGIVR